MCACVFPCVCVSLCGTVFPRVRVCFRMCPPTSPCVHVPTGAQGDEEAEAGTRAGPGPRRTRVQGSRT